MVSAGFFFLFFSDLNRPTQYSKIKCVAAGFSSCGDSHVPRVSQTCSECWGQIIWNLDMIAWVQKSADEDPNQLTSSYQTTPAAAKALWCDTLLCQSVSATPTSICISVIQQSGAPICFNQLHTWPRMRHRTNVGRRQRSVCNFCRWKQKDVVWWRSDIAWDRGSCGVRCQTTATAMKIYFHSRWLHSLDVLSPSLALYWTL